MVLACVSCSQDNAILRAPENLRLNSDTLTLNWNAIDRARGYTVVIGETGKESVVKKNSVSLEYLDPGTYDIKVKANGDGQTIRDSDWVHYSFTRDVESGLKYSLINSGSEYELVDSGNASGDVVMESVYRGKPVTSIASKAFYGNSSITSITVGKNVRSIGKSAFANCVELVRLDFPEDSALTNLETNIFQNSKKLETVVLPDSLETLPQYLFSWCTALKQVTLGKNVKNISAHAFLNCDSLEYIVIPDTVSVIEEYAFSECEAMKSATLGNGIREIHDYAFFNCKALEKIELADGIESIGICAFAGCEKISSVKIPDSCRTLSPQAFQKCYALAEVVLGDGLVTVGEEAFAETKIYEDAQGIFCIDGWAIQAKDKEIKSIVLPSGVYGIAVGAFYECAAIEDVQLTGIKYINRLAFGYCKSIQTAFFDNSLIEIGDQAFYGCELLRKTVLGQSLVRIGAYAFANCKRLANTKEAIDLPNTLTSIGSSAFKNTLAYTNVTVGIVYIDDWAVDIKDPPPLSVYSDVIFDDGTRGISDYCCDNFYISHSIVIAPSVEYIGRGAFYGVYMVPIIILPDNLKYIGDYAFYTCTSAWFGENGHTSIPNKTEYIGQSAFYNCFSMVGLTIPKSVKTIGDYAFYGCKNLGDSELFLDEEKTQKLTGKVIIENGVETIGNRVFYKCENLIDIELPDSVKSLGIRTFYGCNKLKSVRFGNGLTGIPEYTLYKCEALQSVVLPSGVETIGRYAFRGCTALEKIDFGTALKDVGAFAFYGCTSMTSVKLPSGVQSIGEFAFRGCTSLETVIITESVTSIGKHAFYGDNQATILCEAQNANEAWNTRWNSSYLPTVFGAVLSEDKTYLVSFTYEGTVNVSSTKKLGVPVRDGYTFVGFATADGSTEVAYTIENVNQAPMGTTLYTVWAEDIDVSN